MEAPIARNGSGTYSLPQPPFTPGTTIASSAVNSDLSDIAAALTQSISKDGQTVYTGNQPMGGNKLTGLGAGTSPTDSVRVSQVADGSINYGGVAGGTADDITLAPVPGISAYAVGQTFTFTAASDNTGAMTADVSSVGAGDLVWPDGSDLAAGDVLEDGVYEIAVAAVTPIFHLQNSSKPPLPRTGGTMTGTLVMSGAAINEAKGADIASATTTDIGAATGNYVNVTGTTTITGLGTVQAGTERTVTFTGALTLTHNATSLILPGGANIVTVAGDSAVFRSLGSGNWRCIQYTRASGYLISTGYVANSLSGDVALSNTTDFFTGPSVAQGTSGTWVAIGQVSLYAPTANANFWVKLWDGTTVISSARVTATQLGESFCSLAGIISSPAANIRISVLLVSSPGGPGAIVANATGAAKDSTLTAFRIG